MQTLAKNKEFILIREKHTTDDDITFYCSKIYEKQNIGIHRLEVSNEKNKIIGECVKDENGADIYVLELTENGFEDGFNGECVPEGTYQIKRDKTGRFKWFKLINDSLLRNENGTIKAIEVHAGNCLKDTEGCLLFGIGFDANNLYNSGDVIIKNSKNTCNHLLNCVFGNPSKKENQIIGTLEVTTMNKYIKEN